MYIYICIIYIYTYKYLFVYIRFNAQTGRSILWLFLHGTVTQRLTPVDLRAAQLPGADSDSELRLWGCGLLGKNAEFRIEHECWRPSGNLTW